MPYIKTGPNDNNNQLNLRKREEERRKNEHGEYLKNERERKEKQDRFEKNVIQTKLAVKKRLLFLKKLDEEKLEREAGIFDRDIKNLKSDIENEKSGSNNIQTKINLGKHKLAGLMGIINEKKKEQDKLKREISEREKEFEYIKDITKKDELEIIKRNGVSPKQKEEERKESERRRIMQQISILQQEERQIAQEVFRLEDQLKK